MAKGNNQKTATGSALDFEAQLWAAAQAVPALNCNRRKWWPCASTPRNADSFRADLHPDLKADFVPVRKDLANPPFNMSDWGGENLKEDVRWKYGVPPGGNANFAWVQHIVHHLAPNGIAGFVLANGSMSSNQSGEGDIRKNLIEADLVDCMIALPGQLFYGTGIPACLWFLTKTKKNGKFGDRRGKTLFVDARKLGVL